MSNSTTSSGIGFGSLLTVLFIGLKLTNYITWSWWWVLSPLWIPITVLLLVLIIAALIMVLVHLFSKNKPKYRVPKKSAFQQRMEELRDKGKI